jgi:hemoglobin/transferrin/lactoferrin receptor protein
MLEENPRYSRLSNYRYLQVRLWLPILFSTFLFFLPFHLSGQRTQNDIPVVLLDSKTGDPLIGANVYTEDARFQTYTDENGRATITGLSYRDVLIFSYIGYKVRELPIYEIRNKKGRIIMEEIVHEFKGVEVVGRRDDPIKEMPFKIERITNKDIQFSNAQTSADLLEKNGGLFVQKSQMGGGSPIIRGFETSRVLLVVDGVRLNNAIYRNGHLQNSITIDPAILEQAEIIYGPGSLTYGSDALGGVIHYRTKDPKLALGSNEDLVLETNASLRYSSANREKAFHVDFNQGKKKWGSLTSFSMVDYDNLIAGSVRHEAYPNFGIQKFYPINVETRNELAPVRPNRQRGTEYGQIDILQKIKYQANNNLYFVANFQWSSSSSIPRYDNLVDTVSSAKDLKWIEWYYGPQQRILGSIKARILNSKYFDRGTIIAAFQKVDEDRYKRKWRKKWRSASEVDVKVYSLTADFDKFLDEEERTTISYGFDLNRNDVRSDAYEYNVRTKEILIEGDDIITRYPSQGSHMNIYGAYANLKWKSKDQILSAEGGLRYSYASLTGYFGPNDPIAWPQNYIDGIQLKNSATTFGAGVTANTKDKWQFRAMVASAFRAPNIDDFSQIREKNGFVTVPNTNLKPEKSLTFEATIGKEIGGIKTDEKTGKRSGLSLYLSATGFRTNLKDPMIRKNFALPDGQNTLLKGEEILEVQANVNSETANVHGFSGNLKFKVGEALELASSVSFTQGRTKFKDSIEGIIIDTITPFAHIPPLYGKVSLTLNVGKWKLSPVLRFNGRKRPDEYAVSSVRLVNGEIYLRRLGTSDNIDYTPYGFIDPNGNPCDPNAPGGENPTCQEGYAGSLAWMTFNFYGEYKIKDNFSINFGVENIGDLHYRTFASGVSAPGRNFIIGLRGNF